MLIFVFSFQQKINHFRLTFILIVGCDCQNCVLDVLVLIDLGLVQVFVEVRGVVVLVGD
jgi:hypothetical protein